MDSIATNASVASIVMSSSGPTTFRVSAACSDDTKPATDAGIGKAILEGGAAVILRVGERIAPERLPEDWVLVHELCHVSFPNVLRPWAEEGLATYLEPIIRVRAGTLPRDELWRALLEGLPQGQPDDGDQGLDHTDTWGRRYWGGAMFWLLADVEIRKRSGGARGLGDALRLPGLDAEVRRPAEAELYAAQQRAAGKTDGQEGGYGSGGC